MISLWTLPAALLLDERPALVAIVGGGGKTSLMFRLAAELPGRNVLTTTTRIFAAQMGLARGVCYESDLANLDHCLTRYGQCLVVGRVEGDKALGVDPALPARLLAGPGVDHVLVEADGSRMCPVKAPADHEPVIPAHATHLIPVAGIDALEAPLEVIAHRPERLRELLEHPPAPGIGPLLTPDGQKLTYAGLAQIMSHPAGGLKHAPDAALVITFLNKVEIEERRVQARKAAQLMLRSARIGRVVLGAVRRPAAPIEVWRRVTAVVLAAGTSSRMGANKMLLPWGDTTVLGQTLANVTASSVHSCLLVSGHEAEQTEAVADAFHVPSVRNLGYDSGMLTSLQAAIRQLPDDISAVLVCLGDQPMVGSHVIDRLLAAFASHTAGIVAPQHDGRRGNPVLIHRRYFTELLSLPPDSAPRELLLRHPEEVLLVDVEDAGVLYDLDIPADYERLRP